MRKWLNRIFVFLAIPAIVLAFVAPSVSAAGVFPEDMRQVAYQPLFTGNVSIDFLNDIDGFDSQIVLELPEVLAGPAGADDGDTHFYTFMDSSYPDAVDGTDVAMTYSGSVGYYDTFVFGGVEYPLWELGYNFVGSAHYIERVTYHLDPIVCQGTAVDDLLKSLLCVGDGTWVVDMKLEYFDSSQNSYLVERKYTRTIGLSTSNNANYNYATPITGGNINSVAGSINLPYPTSLARVTLDITWRPEDSLYFTKAHLVMPISRRSQPDTPVPFIGGENAYVYTGDQVWEDRVKAVIAYWKNYNGDFSDYDFVGWAGEAMSSIFEIEAFAGVTLGDICFLVLAVSVTFWLLKMFAGG